MIRKMMIAAGLLSILGACDGSAVTKPGAKERQAQKAQKAAESINFSENAEIDNITKRLELTSNPGAVGYIILLNDMGQPIVYTSVIGKVTSSGKRLTKPWKAVTGDRGEWKGDFIVAGPSDEGTWGSSDPYIYFWSATGQYYQWNGGYLYSDKPLRLTVAPLVVDISKSNKKARQ